MAVSAGFVIAIKVVVTERFSFLFQTVHRIGQSKPASRRGIRGELLGIIEVLPGGQPVKLPGQSNRLIGVLPGHRRAAGPGTDAQLCGEPAAVHRSKYLQQLVPIDKKSLAVISGPVPLPKTGVTVRTGMGAVGFGTQIALHAGGQIQRGGPADAGLILHNGIVVLGVGAFQDTEIRFLRVAQRCAGLRRLRGGKALDGVGIPAIRELDPQRAAVPCHAVIPAGQDLAPGAVDHSPAPGAADCGVTAVHLGRLAGSRKGKGIQSGEHAVINGIGHQIAGTVHIRPVIPDAHRRKGFLAKITALPGAADRKPASVVKIVAQRHPGDLDPGHGAHFLLPPPAGTGGQGAAVLLPVFRADILPADHSLAGRKALDGFPPARGINKGVAPAAVPAAGHPAIPGLFQPFTVTVLCIIGQIHHIPVPFFPPAITDRSHGHAGQQLGSIGTHQPPAIGGAHGVVSRHFPGGGSAQPDGRGHFVAGQPGVAGPGQQAMGSLLRVLGLPGPGIQAEGVPAVLLPDPELLSGPGKAVIPAGNHLGAGFIQQAPASLTADCGIAVDQLGGLGGPVSLLLHRKDGVIVCPGHQIAVAVHIGPFAVHTDGGQRFFFKETAIGYLLRAGACAACCDIEKAVPFRHRHLSAVFTGLRVAALHGQQLPEPVPVFHVDLAEIVPVLHIAALRVHRGVVQARRVKVIPEAAQVNFFRIRGQPTGT